MNANLSKRAAQTLFAVSAAGLCLTSVAGTIPASARYYDVLSLTNPGDLADCGNIDLQDWPMSSFRRSGQGGKFLLGLITYQNNTCAGGASTRRGSIEVTVFFYEPTFIQSTDPRVCAPYLTCQIEGPPKYVTEAAQVFPFTAQLTPNTGDVVGDSDGVTVPNNKTLWVPEGRVGSFYYTASYNSPLQILSIIPADSVGFVTEGTDPTGPQSQISYEDIQILRSAGVSPPIIPAQRIAALASAVQGVGPGKSLISKLQALQAYHEAGDIPATCAVVEDFANEVRAQTGKKIPTVFAADFTADAQQLRKDLKCP